MKKTLLKVQRSIIFSKISLYLQKSIYVDGVSQCNAREGTVTLENLVPRAFSLAWGRSGKINHKNFINIYVARAQPMPGPFPAQPQARKKALGKSLNPRKKYLTRNKTVHVDLKVFNFFRLL